MVDYSVGCERDTGRFVGCCSPLLASCFAYCCRCCWKVRWKVDSSLQCADGCQALSESGVARFSTRKMWGLSQRGIVRTGDLPGAAMDERRELHIFHRSEKYLQMVRRKKINSHFSAQGQDENNVCGWLHSAPNQTRKLHRSYGIHGWDEAVRIFGS